MQQAVDDSHDRLERALRIVIQTVGALAAKPLFGTCSAAVATLRQTAQSVTISNPTAADLNCLATRWTAVTGLTLAGEFDGNILVSGGEEGWWSSLQHLTLHHSAPPNPMGRLLLDVPAGEPRGTIIETNAGVNALKLVLQGVSRASTNDMRVTVSPT